MNDKEFKALLKEIEKEVIKLPSGSFLPKRLINKLDKSQIPHPFKPWTKEVQNSFKKEFKRMLNVIYGDK